MNKKNKYLNLIYRLEKASDKFQKDENYSNDLNKACGLIQGYMQNSPNIAETAFEIERFCLEYDRSINLKKNVDRIDARLTGCLGAIKDLNDLQNSSTQYIKDY